MHAPDLTENCRTGQITGVIWGVISGLIVHARGTMATCGIRDRLDLTEERQITGVIWGVICGPMTIGKQARELCVYVFLHSDSLCADVLESSQAKQPESRSDISQIGQLGSAATRAVLHQLTRRSLGLRRSRREFASLP